MAGKITEAAIRFFNDDVQIIVHGKNHERHPDIYDRVTDNPNFHILDYEIQEGFIDEYNHFYNRIDAFDIARHCNQITRYVRRGRIELYIEDLW